jgi:hypothetical protein
MQEVEKYQQYAADCRRLAERASNGDKAVLLQIADAWDQQAALAASRRKPDGR